MSLQSTIDTLIVILTLGLYAWLIIGLILTIAFYYKLIGLTNLFKPAEVQETEHQILFFLLVILSWIFVILTYLLYWSTSLLLIIFGLWLVVLYIVPYIILVPIPFMPFLLPVPIKNLILEFVPPFKILTDKGILPLMRRILFSMAVFFPRGQFKAWFLKSINEIYIFMYDDIKRLFVNISKKIGVDLQPTEPNDDVIEDDYETEEPDDEDAKIKEDEDAIRMRNLIEEETDICVKSKLKLKSPIATGGDEMTANVSNVNIYSDCQAIAIKYYFDNLI
jgi:hypothetical protein